MKLYRSDVKALIVATFGFIVGTLVYTQKSHELGVALWAGHALCALAIFLRGDYLVTINATLRRRSTRRRYLTLFLFIAAIVSLIAGVFSWCMWWFAGSGFLITLIAMRLVILWAFLAAKWRRRRKEKRFTF